MNFEDFKKSNSKSFLKLNPGLSDNCVPARAEQQRIASDEPVAADEGKAADQKCCLVRVESRRRRLCDERNLTDKYFIDALVEAGVLVDDSPKWAQIEVRQVRVCTEGEECTVIYVMEMQEAAPAESR